MTKAKAVVTRPALPERGLPQRTEDLRTRPAITRSERSHYRRLCRDVERIVGGDDGSQPLPLRIALEEALGPSLPAQGCASEEEAERVVAAALDEALAEPSRALAHELVARHRGEKQRRAAEAERERLRREQETRIAADARKVWNRLYGGAVADKLRPSVRYLVVEAAGLVLAVPDGGEQGDHLDRFIRTAGGKINGARGGAALAKISARIAAVAKNDEEALELLAGARRQEQERLELEEQRERHAERDAIERAHQGRRYGVVLSDLRAVD
jgi:hypothetical protein